jgi:predicted GNAT family N-acyltransferase
MNIHVTSFEKSEGEIRSIRDAVFGLEQKVHRTLDWDGKDSRCTHVLAIAPDGNPIGTGRMQPDGRIGRLAVLKPWRGRGVGRGMLEALVEEARALGLSEVHLHAQVHAMDFYRRCGFRKAGLEFMEAGIRHIHMTKTLRPEKGSPRTSFNFKNAVREMDP